MIRTTAAAIATLLVTPALWYRYTDVAGFTASEGR